MGKSQTDGFSRFISSQPARIQAYLPCATSDNMKPIFIDVGKLFPSGFSHNDWIGVHLGIAKADAGNIFIPEPNVQRTCIGIE